MTGEGKPAEADDDDENADASSSALETHISPFESMEKIEKPVKIWPDMSIDLRHPIASLAAVYAAWSYSYIDPVLRKGRSQFKNHDHLEMEDLFRVPKDMESSTLATNFWRLFRGTGTLAKALWMLVAPVYLRAAYWEFVYMCARVSLPLSMRELLIIIEQSSEGESISEKAIPYVFFLTAGAVVGAVAQNRTVFLSTKSGIAIRAALTSAIYEHALRLSPSGRSGLTSGEVTNIAATDTQKLYDVMLEGHNLWSCPVLVVVVSSLLWAIVGPELVIGVVILILFLPIIKVIVGNMLCIRKARAKLTDIRISLLSSMLHGIRVAKLNHYEKMIEENVMKVRNQEISLLHSELRMWGLVLTTAVSSPLIAFGVAFAFHALVHEESIILPSDAFSALLLFSILRFPINLAARLVGKAAQAIEALHRIEAFLVRDAQEHEAKVEDEPSSGTVLRVSNGHFRLDSSDPGLFVSREASSVDATSEQDMDIVDTARETKASFIVSDISFSLKKGQVLAVIGEVGSGKTTLIRALLGEIPALESSHVRISGTISYASQLPFIINASLRENVLFGACYDAKKYEQAITACSLEQDIECLGPAQDLTQIGERGVTLSGQKQRVALARAIYSVPDLVLLDDTFSALDSSTAKTVFDRLFSQDGVLRDGGTVLVTHAYHLLPLVDAILVLEDGAPTFLGSWSELERRRGASGVTNSLVHHRQEKANKMSARNHKRKIPNKIQEKDGKIMTVEEREYGIASFAIWVEWFQKAGGWSFVAAQLVLLCLDRGLYVLSDWWVAFWTEGAYEESTFLGITFPPQSDGRSAQVKFVTVYAIIIALSVLATLVRSLWAVSGGARCAEAMFTAMTSRVLRAPMYFFETTPLGRIINRFTYDIEVLDIELSVSMTGLMISSSWLISAIVVMLTVLPWVGLGIVPVGLAYYFIQLYYRMSGPDLQRIDAMSRSPIQASLAEGLDGSATIRAFRREEQFSESFRQLVDDSTAAMMNFLAAQRWLGVRIEVLGTSMTFACSLIVVCANEKMKISAGLVGLLIQWSVIFSAALNFFFLRLSESEARITSIERIRTTTNLPQEAAWETAVDATIEPSWPSRGELVFEKVCMRYRRELPYALDSVSFKLQPGTRCGVVGRTGAGKTSLIACIFRLVELESGSVFLDGIDLATIGLSDVRGRSNGMRVIPQDPVLFSGTLRDCLDPFHQCSDDKQLLEALIAVNHKGAREEGVKALAENVEEGGSNLSVGERQLLCLARAIVEKPRVLVLDEATANVDNATDAFVQEMLRTKFQDTTLLTIAHRLNTVMDYDVVLVMDNGRVVEFGPPWELLKESGGSFTSLVEATGEESARNLRAIARKRISE